MRHMQGGLTAASSYCVLAHDDGLGVAIHSSKGV